MTNVCQLCGHEEDLDECPTCKRHTCHACFDDMKDKGLHDKICVYCGFVWFVANALADLKDKEILEELNLPYDMDAVIPDRYSRELVSALSSESRVSDVRFRSSLESGDRRQSLMSDVRFRPYNHGRPGDLLRPTEMGEVEPYSQAVTQSPDDDEFLDSEPILDPISPPSQVGSITHEQLDSEYGEIVINLLDENDSPFNLEGATVTWGSHIGLITQPLTGEIRFKISRNRAMEINTHNYIEIRKGGIVYKVSVDGRFDTLRARLPSTGRARQLINDNGDIMTDYLGATQSPQSIQGWTMPDETSIETIDNTSKWDYLFLLGVGLSVLVFIFGYVI